MNNPFYSNPGNSYILGGNFTPGTSYAPQTGVYMAEKFGKKMESKKFPLKKLETLIWNQKGISNMEIRARPWTGLIFMRKKE